MPKAAELTAEPGTWAGPEQVEEACAARGSSLPGALRQPPQLFTVNLGESAGKEAGVQQVLGPGIPKTVTLRGASTGAGAAAGCEHAPRLPGYSGATFPSR